MRYLDNYFRTVAVDKRSTGAIAFMASLDHIHSTYPLVAENILQELRDQRSYLKLIASENYSSLAVQQAMGNLLTDKYAEGYPGHRFYAGCDNIDAIESAAVQEVQKLFGAEHAYVQPHSGADANLVAFWAILIHNVQNREIEKCVGKTLDTLSSEEYENIRRLLCNQRMLGMSLNSGGHLTHGYRHNVSAKMFQSFGYDVDADTGILDYATVQARAEEVRPLVLLAGYSAYPRLVNFAKMKEIAHRVGAVLMVDMAHFAGLVAGKALRGDFDPVPFADIITSTTHKTLRGPRGGFVLCKASLRESVDKGCPMILGGPLPHVMAAKAIAFREAQAPAFSIYAHQVIANARALASRLMASGAHVLTGGTDNHLVLVNVEKSFGITGRQAELLLRSAGLTVNRNAVPYDRQGPWYTSGIRLGPPALTTRGLKEKEMEKIGDLLVSLLKTAHPVHDSKGVPSRAQARCDPHVLARVREEVQELLVAFPLYPELVIDPTV